MAMSHRAIKHFLTFCYRFNLLKEHLVEFNQLAMSNADGSHDMINRVMTKDNIALAALLETKEAAWENGRFFAVIIKSQLALLRYYKFITLCSVLMKSRKNVWYLCM